MSKLELKVPPVLLVVLFAVAMYAMSAATIEGRTDGIPTLLSVICAIAGSLICMTGVVQFRKVRTTVNPVNPASASSLVTGGIYKVSRNPMYLGFLLILLAWAFFLSNAYSAAAIPFFVFYMNRFQIFPEERALARLFGHEFTTYASKVRRWI